MMMMTRDMNVYGGLSKGRYYGKWEGERKGY
jgi:hypothetical protein